MKQLPSVLLLSFTIVASAAATSFAQNRERFGISAKAGGVNAVAGHVMVNRKDQAPQLLTSQDDLAANDVVITGATANIEVLLNPGSYFRVGENSEFGFKSTDLNNLRLKLVNGIAILEVTGVDGVNPNIVIDTPHATFSILRAGLYRINVQAQSTELAVRNGRASFGSATAELVKGGKKVTISNGLPTIAKLQKDKDSFDLWSKQRAELLARANEKLSGRQLNGYLSSFRDAGFGGSRWGLWTFSSRMGCYTFLPFFYGWSSPYGHYYGSYLDPYYWGGRGWGRGNISPGTGIIVNNQPPTGSTGNNPGGVPPAGGPPTPSFVPSPSEMPRGAPRDPDSGGRANNRSREP